jgi:hypothetical protein
MQHETKIASRLWEMKKEGWCRYRPACLEQDRNTTAPGSPAACQFAGSRSEKQKAGVSAGLPLSTIND